MSTVNTVGNSLYNPRVCKQNIKNNLFSIYFRFPIKLRLDI